MKVRKRTKSGKSQNMKVVAPLEFVAKDTSTGDLTLSFELNFYETKFNLTLTKNKAEELAKDILNAVKEKEHEE